MQAHIKGQTLAEALGPSRRHLLERIVDGSEHLWLTVTLNDLSKGTPGSRLACAAARCAKRMPGVQMAYVSHSRVYLVYADRIERYILDEIARRAVRGFDTGQIIFGSEMKFRLRAPGPGMQLGTDRRKRPPHKPTKPRAQGSITFTR